MPARQAGQRRRAVSGRNLERDEELSLSRVGCFFCGPPSGESMGHGVRGGSSQPGVMIGSTYRATYETAE